MMGDMRPTFAKGNKTTSSMLLDYTSGNFGKIASTRDGQNDQREIQFALKFYF